MAGACVCRNRWTSHSLALVCVAQFPNVVLERSCCGSDCAMHLFISTCFPRSSPQNGMSMQVPRN